MLMSVQSVFIDAVAGMFCMGIRLFFISESSRLYKSVFILSHTHTQMLWCDSHTHTVKGPSCSINIKKSTEQRSADWDTVVWTLTLFQQIRLMNTWKWRYKRTWRQWLLELSFRYTEGCRTSTQTWSRMTCVTGTGSRGPPHNLSLVKFHTDKHCRCSKSSLSVSPRRALRANGGWGIQLFVAHDSPETKQFQSGVFFFVFVFFCMFSAWEVLLSVSAFVSLFLQAVRVTKPHIPESVLRNYELMWVSFWSAFQKLMIAACLHWVLNAL